MTDQEFFLLIKSDVIEDMKRTGILASLTAAQAYIESNKGNSGLTQKANNLFGMKGAYNGQYITMKTKEFSNGKYITVNAKFRKYPSWKESIEDHSGLFLRLSRYENLRGEKNYIQACKKVQQDGYATSPVYADTLIRIIEKYKLYEWDECAPDPELDEAIITIAKRVIRGDFGYGHETRKDLIYVRVRQKVNEMLK